MLVRPSVYLSVCVPVTGFPWTLFLFFLKFCLTDLETGKSDRNGLILVCLKRKASISLEIFHGDIHQGRVTSETFAFGGVCPGMPSHAQTGLNYL